jgi:methylated-DNA-[protein]-cysteine S-methyltransferase
MKYTTMDSPLGELLLLGDNGVLHGLHMQAGRHPIRIQASWIRDDEAFADVRTQLEEYFGGTRESFDVQMHMGGTAFQRTVWHELTQIPYGETISYGELARRVGSPRAVRAVGLANGRNPLAIIVPCHRVIGANGKLVGYGGGLDNKRRLLELESGVASLL